MVECELLETCGFFRVYGDTLDMACRGFVKTFCKGEQMDECKRKKYRLQHGEPPIDDMMPSGQMIPEAYRVST